MEATNTAELNWVHLVLVAEKAVIWKNEVAPRPAYTG